MSLNTLAAAPLEAGLPIDPLNFATGHVNMLASAIGVIAPAAIGIGIVVYGARKCLQGIGVIG